MGRQEPRTSQPLESSSLELDNNCSSYEQEQQEAASLLSTRSNEALHRLSNPLRRVEYILEREGFGLEESDSMEDPLLLMETMESQEEIQGAESREEVEQVRAVNAGA